MAMTAKQAHERARSGHGVIGWKLDREQRAELLQQFPPVYPNVDADHVTLKVRTSPDAALPGETVGEIVGRTDDGEGVEALVVRIDGTTDRPDGSTYHITWSLSPGRKARESNDVIRTRGWTPVEPPVQVKLEPARF